MDGVDSTRFSQSQWHDCINSSGGSIPPYGIGEAYGTSGITVNGISRPAILVRVPTSDNPISPVFTGPMGVPAGKSGICHSEPFGYAAHSGSLSTSQRYGVDSGSSLLDQRTGDFYGVGDTFTSGGNNVSLFYRRNADVARKIQFTIVSVSGSTATVVVTYASCEGRNVFGMNNSCQVTVHDTLGCILNTKDPADWVGYKGMASLLQPVVGSQCEISGACIWAIDAICC